MKHGKNQIYCLFLIDTKSVSDISTGFTVREKVTFLNAQISILERLEFAEKIRAAGYVNITTNEPIALGAQEPPSFNILQKCRAERNRTVDKAGCIEAEFISSPRRQTCWVPIPSSFPIVTTTMILLLLLGRATNWCKGMILFPLMEVRH